MTLVKLLILGFIAGFLATLIFHQGRFPGNLRFFSGVWL